MFLPLRRGERRMWSCNPATGSWQVNLLSSKHIRCSGKRWVSRACSRCSEWEFHAERNLPWVEPMNDVPRGYGGYGGQGRQLVPIPEGVPALRDPYGRVSLYGGGLGEEGEQSKLNLFEYIRVLNKHKWLILS